MSREQVSIGELLLSLDSSELQEVEQVRAAVNQQLSTDRGGAVLSSLVDHYLDTSSPQVVLLLSSIREPHHKTLLEKLNEVLGRPGSRLAALTLLGHLIRKQPPWVHHISRSALLSALLRCLKTDTDVVVLITGVLVLITLLPMIPQAGKQHIYDFFDVMKENLDTFQEVVKVSTDRTDHHRPVQTTTDQYRPPQTSTDHHRPVQTTTDQYRPPQTSTDHHRPVQTTTDQYRPPQTTTVQYRPVQTTTDQYRPVQTTTDQYRPPQYRPPQTSTAHHRPVQTTTDQYRPVVVTCVCVSVCQPMLEHVRVHPELVTGTQDYELDPTRWRCYEVHDIVIECSRVSLDPLDSSCEDDPPSIRDAPSSSPLPHLNLTPESVSSSGGSFCPPPGRLTLNNSDIQADDVTWSPSSQCGLSTPPPEPAATGPAHPLSRTTSISGVRCPSSATVPVTLTEDIQDGGLTADQVKTVMGSAFQPITDKERGGQSDVIINNNSDEVTSQQPSSSSSSVLLTSTPGHHGASSGPALHPPPCSISLCFTPSRSSSEDGGPAHSGQSPAPSYDPLFELALPRAAALFIGKKTQEVMESAGGGGGGEDREEEQAAVSPLEVLDQLIVHGHNAHEGLSRSQLQYERFTRQQHAIRNRRLLRRVINATVLEEHSVAMKAQLSIQDEEIRSLKSSLEEEQRRHTQLQEDAHTHTTQLHTHIQQLLLQLQDEQRDKQRLQSELQECQSRLKDLEAEFQKANNKAYNAEHQLTQLSIKHRQKLEAANHRIAELEGQLTKKDQLIQDQKKLLEDTKNQSRAELTACESRCVSLRRLTQALQTEMLHLYSQIHLDTQSRPQDVCSRPNGGSVALPAPQGAHMPRPSSSSSLGIINGLSTSPLHLPSCSSSPLSLSPIESPLAVGSFLEQRARELFRPTNHSQEEEQQEGDEEEEKEEMEEEEDEEAQPESPQLGQEAEEVTLLTGSPQTEPPVQALSPSAPPSAPLAPPTDLTLAVRQRRHELSLMDYNETLPEY
ncbi:Hamartin [Nibea albiflora]|nr:Hamartin [Nibea albiflora]